MAGKKAYVSGRSIQSPASSPFPEDRIFFGANEEAKRFYAKWRRSFEKFEHKFFESKNEKFLILELPKDSSPELPEDSSPELPEDSSPELPEDSSPELPEDSSPELPEDSSPELPKKTLIKGIDNEYFASVVCRIYPSFKRNCFVIDDAPSSGGFKLKPKLKELRQNEYGFTFNFKCLCSAERARYMVIKL